MKGRSRRQSLPDPVEKRLVAKLAGRTDRSAHVVIGSARATGRGLADLTIPSTRITFSSCSEGRAGAGSAVIQIERDVDQGADAADVAEAQPAQVEVRFSVSTNARRSACPTASEL